MYRNEATCQVTQEVMPEWLLVAKKSMEQGAWSNELQQDEWNETGELATTRTSNHSQNSESTVISECLRIPNELLPNDNV